MDEHRRLGGFSDAIGKTHVVSVGVRENDGFHILDTSLKSGKPLKEYGKVTWKAGVNERETSGFFDDVPIEWAGGKVVNACCELHACTSALQAPQ